MKDLKYIKLFEAFESIKLGKTLGFLNSNAKNIFLNELKQISKIFDFPISDFSDDMFEYLPFRSALRVNTNPKVSEREVCDYESEWIPGQFCSGGQVKRTWGKGFRIITCPKCKGSGLKPEKKIDGEVEIIKFWFDKDGNYVVKTGCDGIVRETNVQAKPFSRNIDDYEIGENLSYNKVRQLPHGTIILFARNGYSEERQVVSMVYHYSGRTYILQDEFDGTSPGDRNWDDFANCSWSIGYSDDFGSAKSLKLKVAKEEKEEENPYDWNTNISIDPRRNRIMHSGGSVEDNIKKAHFSLILDLNKLKSLKYKPVSQTRIERELTKSGLELLKPENVKTANIERYMKTLASKFDVEKGIQEVTRILPRALGFNNSFTFVLNSVNLSRLDSLVSNIRDFMIDTDEYYKGRVIRTVNDIYKVSEKSSIDINTGINGVWKLIDAMEGEKKEKISKYFEQYLEIGVILNNQLKSADIETISDFEFAISRLKAIRDILYETRVRSLTYLRNISEYLFRGNAGGCLDYLSHVIENHPNALEELKGIIKNIRL